MRSSDLNRTDQYIHYDDVVDTVHVFGELQHAADIRPAKFGSLDKRNLRLSWIQILRTGSWDHPVYGKVTINENTFKDLVRNHEANVRGIDIAIDTEHKEDKGAVGWIKKLVIKPGSLWALVEWTNKGLDLITDKVYRYVSAEFSPKYVDPETKRTIPNVLIAVTLTNRPFIKGMAPVLLSETGLRDRLMFEYEMDNFKKFLVEPYKFEQPRKRSKAKEVDVDIDGEDELAYPVEYIGGDEEDLEEDDDYVDPLFLPLRGNDYVRSLNLRKGGSFVPYTDLEYPVYGAPEEVVLEYPDFDYDEEEDYELPDVALDEEVLDDLDDDYALGFDEGYDDYEDYGGYGDYDDLDDGSGLEFEEPAVEDSLVVPAVDPAAREAAYELSEQVLELQEQNRQLQEALKFEAVEGIVDNWVLDERGIGRIPPQLRDLATYMLMKFSDEDAALFRQFVEALPGCFEYGERGMSVPDDTQSFDLQARARQIYAEGQKIDRNFQFRDALKQAYIELTESY